MEFPEERLKKMISEYRENGSGYDGIVEVLSEWIINYPIKIFGVDYDTAMDYYEYILERFENIVVKYNNKAAKLKTYLFIVFRNSYFNWYKSRKRLRNREILINDLSQSVQMGFSAESSFFSGNKKNDFVTNIFLDNNNIINNKNLFSVLELLPNLEKIAIKLMYYEITGDDIKLIAKLRKEPVKNIIRDYNERIGISVKRRIKYNDSVNKLNEVRTKLVDLRKSIEAGSENEIRETELKIKRISKKLISLYPRFKNDSISKIMGINKKEISRIIYRAKNLIRKELI